MKPHHFGSNQRWPHLVLHQEGALWGVGEVSSGSLHHQFKGGVWLDIGEILFPQDGARAALDAKKLQDKQVTGSLLERQTEELILSMKIRARAVPHHPGAPGGLGPGLTPSPCLRLSPSLPSSGG